jgi:tol-pal system protein YbgF
MTASSSYGRKWIVALAALPALTGCYGKRISAVEVRTARTEDRLTVLEKSQKDLTAEVLELRRKVADQIELLRAGKAASEAHLREIDRGLQVLAQRVDESGELYRELKDSLRYPASPAPGAAADSVSASATTPRAVYDAAYQDLTRGNHGLAIMGFQEVISKFAGSELADNAQYWIGESYYAQKDFKHALQEFQKTIDTYPKGDKVPAALLKVGLCQQQLGDKGAARAAYQMLMEKYPQSEEARLARTKQQDL